MTRVAHPTRKSVCTPRAIAVLRTVGIGLAASTTIGLGVALAGPAAADPARVPLTLQCDALGSIRVSVPARAPFTPGLDTGSTQVGIPYSLTVTTTFTPMGGEPQTSVEHYSRPAPANSRHDRCTFHDEGSNAAGTITLDGVVLISYTPR
jgi:hypothetical protein